LVPTAQALRGEVAATPRRTFTKTLEGLGLGTSAHELPFQCSITVAHLGPQAFL
jgi:hypothetical protein